MSGAPPAPGSIAAWWSGHGLCFGVVVAEEKSRLRVVTRRGREERIKPARLAATIGPPGPVDADTPEGRRAAGERAATVAEEVGERAARVDVALLWEVVLEGGLDEADPDELAGLAIDDDDGRGVARAAVQLALASEGMRFVRRGETWTPRDRSQVEALALERERVAAREREREATVAALAQAARGGAWEPTGTETERRYLDALEQLALLDLATPEATRALALEALQSAGAAGERPHAAAFRLLRRVGRFAHDDVNLPLLRYGFPVEFPREALDLAEAAATRGVDAAGREDLRGLTAVSIDGPTTKEIDDLLSAEPLDDGRIRLGVHIADPAAFVEPGDPLDLVTRARAITHYHPDVAVRMLPPRLCEDAASLNAGVDRPALSFFADVAPDGAIEATRIVRSLVRSAGRLEYATVDRALADGAGEQVALLRVLDELAVGRERRREADGAILLRTPDVDVRVDAAGAIHLERLDADSAARRIVTEAMVLAGWLAARFCIENGIPAIYRVQSAPTNGAPLPPGGTSDPVAARRVRMTLRRAESSLDPLPHAALALTAYAQATSPLRRYQDLAVHRQIVAALAGDAPPYDGAALREIVAETGAIEADARAAERASNEYWMLRWFESRRGDALDAVVVGVDPRPVVHVSEAAWEQPVPGVAGLELGARVSLRVERVDPRAGVLVLRPEP